MVLKCCVRFDGSDAGFVEFSTFGVVGSSVVIGTKTVLDDAIVDDALRVEGADVVEIFSSPCAVEIISSATRNSSFMLSNRSEC